MFLAVTLPPSWRFRVISLSAATPPPSPARTHMDTPAVSADEISRVHDGDKRQLKFVSSFCTLFNVSVRAAVRRIAREEKMSSGGFA